MDLCGISAGWLPTCGQAGKYGIGLDANGCCGVSKCANTDPDKYSDADRYTKASQYSAPDEYADINRHTDPDKYSGANQHSDTNEYPNPNTDRGAVCGSY